MTRARLVKVAKTTSLVVVTAAVTMAVAKGPGILFPDWSGPTKGSYDEPAGSLGSKVTDRQPWSITTVASSIKGEPVEGKAVSIVGEIIDLSCYLQVGKRGDKHRGCGQKCVENGQPVGLLQEDGSVYMLIDEEHNQRRDGLTEFRKQAIENMAHIVRVNGTLTEVAGQKAIYVQGYLKKQ